MRRMVVVATRRPGGECSWGVRSHALGTLWTKAGRGATFAQMIQWISVDGAELASWG